MAKTYSGLFEKITSFDALYAAYLSARKGKRKNWACRIFEKDLEGNLIDLQDALLTGTYRTGTYKKFLVHEPKTRCVSALQNFRDRVVQHAVMRVIEPIWESRFISDSYACRVGKGTHSGVNRTQSMLQDCLQKHGKVYVLKADIKKYFASIDHSRLKLLVRKRIADKEMLVVLDDIIDSYSESGSQRRGLPIGNLTSQLFANLYLDLLDQWVKCRNSVKWYVRYMDDFILVHPDKRYLHAMRVSIETWLRAELKLETNHKTSVFPVAHLRGRGLDYLGYHIWPDRRRLRKTSLRRFKRRANRLQKRYAEGALGIRDVRKSLNSMIAHAKHGGAASAVNRTLDEVFRRAA